jgi:hypothetical protein
MRQLDRACRSGIAQPLSLTVAAYVSHRVNYTDTSHQSPFSHGLDAAPPHQGIRVVTGLRSFASRGATDQLRVPNTCFKRQPRAIDESVALRLVPSLRSVWPLWLNRGRYLAAAWRTPPFAAKAKGAGHVVAAAADRGAPENGRVWRRTTGTCRFTRQMSALPLPRRRSEMWHTHAKAAAAAFEAVVGGAAWSLKPVRSMDVNLPSAAEWRRVLVSEFATPDAKAEASCIGATAHAQGVALRRSIPDALQQGARGTRRAASDTTRCCGAADLGVRPLLQRLLPLQARLAGYPDLAMIVASCHGRASAHQALLPASARKIAALWRHLSACSANRSVHRSPSSESGSEAETPPHCPSHEPSPFGSSPERTKCLGSRAVPPDEPPPVPSKMKARPSPRWRRGGSFGALMYQRLGDFENALVSYREVLQRDEVNVEAHNNLGVLYRDKGLYDEAIRHFQRAIAIDPRYARARNNLGVVYLAQRRFDTAATQFHAALSIDPRNVEALVNLSTQVSGAGRRATPDIPQ